MASPANKKNHELFQASCRTVSANTYIFIHFKLQQRQLPGQLERVQRQQIELVLAAQRQVVLDRRRAVPERERYLPMVVLAFVLWMEMLKFVKQPVKQSSELPILGWPL